jgi:hypothetical protein
MRDGLGCLGDKLVQSQLKDWLCLALFFYAAEATKFPYLLVIKELTTISQF